GRSTSGRCRPSVSRCPTPPHPGGRGEREGPQADHEPMHDPWTTWRHTTGVPTHAAMTERLTSSHKTCRTRLHTCPSFRLFPVFYAMMGRMDTQAQYGAERRRDGLCGGGG